MVERLLPKQKTRVRFSLPALFSGEPIFLRKTDESPTDFQFPSIGQGFDFPHPHCISVDNFAWYTRAHNLTRMDKNVTIYSTPTCHFCQMAKEFFKEKGVGYTEFNVAQDLEKRQEMIQKSGQMGVPVIFVGNDLIIGFDKERLASSLGVTA